MVICYAEWAVDMPIDYAVEMKIYDDEGASPVVKVVEWLV
jgi:hypothetical protein